MGIEDRMAMFTRKIADLLAEFEMDGATVVVVREEEMRVAAIVADNADCADMLNGLARYLNQADICLGCGYPNNMPSDCSTDDGDNDNRPPSTRH